MNKYLSGLLLCLLALFFFNNLNCISQEVETSRELMPIDIVAPEHNALQLGIEAYKEGRFKDAIKYFTIAVNKNPYNSYTSLWLGNAYFHNENYENAVNCYNNAIEENNNYGLAYYNLSIAYERLGDMDEAQNAMEKFEAIKKNINNDDE